MGLDMYLYTNSKALSDSLDLSDIYDFERRAGCVMYWRKANAIHRYFVERCQNGVDDCGLYEVELSDLSELLVRCDKVLESPWLSDKILPTMDGFFFGETAYDDYYLQELKQTRDRISEIMELVEGDHVKGESDWEVRFMYRSSW